MHNYDCITRRTVFRNADTREQNFGNGDERGERQRGTSKVIQKASSITLDFESASSAFHMIQLSGR